MSDKPQSTREAIAQTAKMVQQHNNKNGGSMTSGEARRYVERCREQGDRKRDSNR